MFCPSPRIQTEGFGGLAPEERLTIAQNVSPEEELGRHQLSIPIHGLSSIQSVGVSPAPPPSQMGIVTRQRHMLPYWQFTPPVPQTQRAVVWSLQKRAKQVMP
jgi:hypothetical protein